MYTACFFLKTNHRRGGFIENIYLEDIEGLETCFVPLK